MKCSKCSAIVPDDAAFCPECGSAVEVIPAPASTGYCAVCGAEIVEGSAFCGNCGTRIGVTSVPAVTEPSKEKKAFPFRKILRVAVCFVVLVAVALAAMALFEGGSDSYVVYIKDNQLQYGQLPKMESPLEVTSKFGNEWTENPGYWNSRVHVTKDGKKLFYPDRVQYNSYGSIEDFTLYCRYLNNAKKDPLKIDSGIDSYQVNEAGNQVYYIKNGNLYLHNLKDKEKIDSDVSNYQLSEDGKTVFYTTYTTEVDGSRTYTLYLRQSGKDPEKIASGVYKVKYVSKDCAFIAFIKNDSLYVKKGSNEAEKISSDVENVCSVCKDGGIYYTKQEAEELSYADLIQNDLTDEDAARYYENLKTSTYGVLWSTLYYYDGSTSVKLTDKLVDWYDFGSDCSVLMYNCYEEELPKMALSEYVNGSFSDWLDKILRESTVTYVAQGSTSVAVDVGYVDDAIANKAGTVLYSAEEDPETENCTVYKISLEKGATAICELLDDEVYWYSWYAVNDDLLYFKEVNEEREGELYLNQELIDEDVYVYSMVSYDEEHGKIYYMMDIDHEIGQGTLMCYDGKDSKAIKEDITLYMLTENGDVLFLYDYNIQHYKGELWIQSGRKQHKLEDDVAYIVSVK